MLGPGVVAARRHQNRLGFAPPIPGDKTPRRGMKIDFLVQEEAGKVAAVESILARTGFTWAEICYLGDDIVDLGVLKRVGAAIVVANGVGKPR
jgi:3-deoxy-D-manno-octulosonate 8-phosphate phosphatase KdsC-like HAD superfamily phosphatase